MIEKYLSAYKKICDNIDLKISKILSFYKNDILCAKGCSSCCMEITLLPVEFFSIKYEFDKRYSLKNLSNNYDIFTSRNESNKKECIFLKNSICMIYESRPVICRTQGLPLLYYSDLLENYTISFCEKNFTLRNDDFELDTEFTIDLDRLNSSLYRLNKEFTEEINNSAFTANKRISISLLVSGNIDYTDPSLYFKE